MLAHKSGSELVGQVGDGDADHAWWGRPEEMTMDRYHVLEHLCSVHPQALLVHHCLRPGLGLGRGDCCCPRRRRRILYQVRAHTKPLLQEG